ncbi:MAG: hypothetical protein IJS74_02720 [Clostridia bacterium]|nr:hypothetical protein [Clostridia bacterium]
MKKLLAGDYENYIASFSHAPKRAVRVNHNFISDSDFEKTFPYPVKKIEGIEGAYLLETGEKIGNSVFHHAGMIYLQEPSSMLAATALEVKEGDLVCDMCSAPGGKASQILDKNKTGIVVCNEFVRPRANVLFSNIERQGFKNAIITSLDTSVLAENFANYFDKILVDAPCSGEGMFRKEPETISEWNEGLPQFNSQRQLEILANADKMLKQGGTLVYSTCTFNLIENELVVTQFCEKYGYKICDLPEVVQKNAKSGFDIAKFGYKTNNVDTTKCARCFPQDNFGEGQFIAKLQKISENNGEIYKQKSNFDKLSNSEMLLIKDFLKQTIGETDFEFYKIKDDIFISEKSLPGVSKGVLGYGVKLGTLAKNRIEPFHQFFKAYGNQFKNKVELKEENDIKNYLYGNEIDIDKNLSGLVSVTYHGAVLGGGKAVQGKLKNYYPKGLRNNKL